MKRTQTGVRALWLVLPVIAWLLCPLPAICAEEGGAVEAEGLLDNVWADVAAKKYAMAEEACRSLLTTYPDQECYVRLMLAEVYGGQGRFEDAVEEATKVLEIAGKEPANADAVEAAREAVERFSKRNEEFNREAAELKQVMDSAQEREQYLDAKSRLAYLALTFGKADMASKACAEIVAERLGIGAKGPAQMNVLDKAFVMLQVVCKQLAAEGQMGDEIFAGIQELVPALEYRRGGDYQQAAEICRQVIQHSAEHRNQARLLLAETHYLQGQFDRAVEESLDAVRSLVDGRVPRGQIAEGVRGYTRFATAFATTYYSLRMPFIAVMENAKPEGVAELYKAAVVDYHSRADVVQFAIERLETLYSDLGMVVEAREGDERFQGVEALSGALELKASNKYEPATAACKEVLASASGPWHEARLLLAELCWLQGDREGATLEAVAAFKEASEEPSNASHVVEAGRAIARFAQAGGLDAETVAELQRLRLSGQSQMGLVFALPLCEKIIAERCGKVVAEGVGSFKSETFPTCFEAALKMRVRAVDHVARVPREPGAEKDQTREEVARFYSEVLEDIPQAWHREVQLLPEAPDPACRLQLTGLDEAESRFLEEMRRCFFLELDRSLADLPDTEGSVGVAGDDLALADWVLAFMLLTREDAQVVEDFRLLPERFKTAPQLAEFGRFAVGTGHIAVAAPMYQEAAAKAAQPEDAAAYLVEQGGLLRGLKEPGEALKVFRRVVEEFPQASAAPGAQMRIVRLFQEEWKSPITAVEECRRLVELFPESAEAVRAEFLIGQLFYLDRSYEDAVVALEAAIGKYRDTYDVGNARLLLAMSYTGAGKSTKGLAVLREVVRDYPTQEVGSRAQYLIGQFYLGQQDYAKALEEFRELLRRYPESEYAARVKQLTERLQEAVEK